MITFVIPTIGRPTLERTVQSLMSQTNRDWKAIIVFDGVDPIDYGIKDIRITELHLPEPYGNRKLNGNAGFVRNEGLRLISTPWIGFVDDDDWITQDYVECISRIKDYDLVVFRMLFGTEVIPSPHDSDKLKEGFVGISFAVKRDFIENHNIWFQNCDTEDFEFLNGCINSGARWTLTQNIAYIVGNPNYNRDPNR